MFTKKGPPLLVFACLMLPCLETGTQSKKTQLTPARFAVSHILPLPYGHEFKLCTLKKHFGDPVYFNETTSGVATDK